MTASLLLWIALAAPTPDLDQARTLYQAGSDAFRTGKYALAIDAFNSARKIVERPTVLFSLGQAHRLKYFLPPSTGGGLRVDLQGAVEAYRAAIAQGITGERRVHATQHLSILVPVLQRAASDGDEAANTKARLIVTSRVEGAEAWIPGHERQPVPATFEVEPGDYTVHVAAPKHTDAMRSTAAVKGTAVATAIDPTPIPGVLQVKAPDGARIQLGDKLVGRSPLPTPLTIAPGAYELIVRARGRQPSTRRFALASAETLAVDIELEPTVQRTASWLLIGVGGALAVSAGTTAWYAVDAQDDAEALRSRLGMGVTDDEFARYSDLRDTRDGFSNATLALSISAGTALVTGLMLYLFDDPDPVRTESLSAGAEPGWR